MSHSSGQLPPRADQEAKDQRDEELRRLYPPLPTTERPFTRRMAVTTAESGLNSHMKVGLTLDEVLRSEVQDYLDGLRHSEERGISAEEYAQGEDDRAIWEGGRLLAVLVPRPEGQLALIRDDAEPTRFRPWVDPDQPE